MQPDLRGGGVEDTYRLSPGQEGILFHSLYEPGSGAYLSRFSLTLAGRPDVEALRAAWQGALDRHAALRASFAWEGVPEPRQLVHRDVDLPWEVLDWSALPAAEREDRREAYLRAGAERGFDLAAPPLMRVALLRTGAEEWEMVWTYHHLLLDGWSVPLVLRDVLALYAAAAGGREPALPAPPPHGDYFAWLEGRDPAASEAFWRAELGSFA
ncbi:MAG TPA: condensation domain-containing protein, partial [Longimicrobiaceae bacterium]|nr:condensation domain-containing protein [Longimicrobiaceae bacterium]